MSLSEKEKAMCRHAAQEAVKDFAEKHICRFNDPTAKMIHEAYEAKVGSGADAGTFRIILDWGRSAQDMTKTVRRVVLFALLVVVVSIFGQDIVGLVAKAFKW